jgi:hypothetical protein
MEKKESLLNREEFKMLTENERKFVEKPDDLLKKYKSSDAMKRQYSHSIKYRTIKALKEIAWLCDKLTEDKLKKIFTPDLIPDVLRITEIALKMVTNDLDDDLKNKYKSKLDDMQISLMSQTEQYAYDKLHRSEYARYSRTGGFYDGLLNRILFLIDQSTQKELMLAESILKEKGLYKEYERRKNSNIDAKTP